MKLSIPLLSLLSPFALFADDTIAIDAELKKTWPSNRTVNIVFHGHSVPSGYHLTPTVKPFESYPHLFRVALKNRYPNAVLNVITTSIGGENAISGAARFTADVLPHKPDLIYIDYALNDRNTPIADVETAWRSMITDAKTANIPLVLLTPTGATNADFSDPADPLTLRADLIRTLAAEEDVMLADLSAAWLDELDSGTSEASLLSQGNHPNLSGHTLASEVIYQSYLAGLGSAGSVTASDFPQDQSTNTFTTADTLLTFITTNSFSGQGNFIGDSGGPANKINSWDGDETLSISLAQNAQLTGFQLRWTATDLLITGFTQDPGAAISTAGGTNGTATWDPDNSTLLLSLPWDGGNDRTITFANPQSTTGQVLNLSFTRDTPGWQASFVSFQYSASSPSSGLSPFSVPLQFDDTTAYLTFQGKAGFTYEMETSPSMEPGSWTVIDTSGPLSASELITLSDTNPVENEKFYRISVSSP